MRKFTYIFTMLIAGIFLAACSADDLSEPDRTNQNIELKLSVKDFKGESLLRSVGTPAENKIDNLYVFLFPTTSEQTLEKYYIDAATFGGGSWDLANTITLGLTQADAGERDVYIVANCDDLEDDLDGVTTPSDLNGVLRASSTPWNMTTPLLMTGKVASHDFATTPVLSTVPMERAVAKLVMNITLTEQYQSEDEDDYEYRLLNFDKNTYVVKPALKTNDLVSQSAFNAIGGDIVFVKNGSTVIGFTYTTYLNERDNADGVNNTTLELKLPFWDNGAPPPQFLDEYYLIKLVEKIERNHFYTYDVTM